ncbi:MAG TPA: hypothetical protein VMV69_08450 [Pirellulales bacterium]|nr:hypothetical protein [Pirellulales bacterium]
MNPLRNGWDKYQLIRSRFINNFYFSGRVAVEIVPDVGGNEITFGDQTIYMGLALIAFSAEMALLRRAGVDASDARRLVKELLDGIEELERQANSRFGSSDANPDGLFARDDITGPTDPRLGGRFTTVNSDWQHPEKENASPSGDQVFGLMMGLHSVVKLSGDDTFVQQSRGISSRLFEYARRTDFILQLPNGNPTRRGSDMRWLASLANGLNKAITGVDRFRDSHIRIEGFPIPLNAVAALWSDSTTPATIAELAGRTLHVPIINKDFELNSSALHLLLMALSASEVWTQGDLELVAMRCHHHLSAMLYADDHGTLPRAFDVAAIDQILDACPDGGPRAGLNPASGWAHDDRWIRCTDIFKPNKGNAAYNGLDWLVLCNCRRLVSGEVGVE